MINPRRGSDAWDVLALVVRNPGEMDAEIIGAKLWVPRLTTVAAGPVTWEGYLRWRTTVAVVITDKEGNDHTILSPATTQRASKLLGQLTSAGYVDRIRRPTLAEGIPLPPAGATAEDLTAWAETILDEVDVQIRPAAFRVLCRLVQGKPPDSVKAWIGSRPSGPACRGVAALYENGVVIAPTFRFPTQRGIDLIEGRAPARPPKGASR